MTWEKGLPSTLTQNYFEENSWCPRFEKENSSTPPDMKHSHFRLKKYTNFKHKTLATTNEMH